VNAGPAFRVYCDDVCRDLGERSFFPGWPVLDENNACRATCACGESMRYGVITLTDAYPAAYSVHVRGFTCTNPFCGGHMTPFIEHDEWWGRDGGNVTRPTPVVP